MSRNKSRKKSNNQTQFIENSENSESESEDASLLGDKNEKSSKSIKKKGCFLEQFYVVNA
jgi:hypothetical protein